jgi:hypothetical protein
MNSPRKSPFALEDIQAVILHLGEATQKLRQVRQTILRKQFR